MVSITEPGMTPFPFFYTKPSVPYFHALDIFNRIERREPQFVALPQSIEDLRQSIRWASDEGYSVSIRGGGHGVSGRAVKGDLVIDMRGFKDMKWNNSKLQAGAGTTWGMLDSFSEKRRIVVPGGTVSTTGVAGLTLGGGIGWLLPMFGLTCDHLISVRGVAANGEVLHIDDATDAAAMEVLRGFGHGLLAVYEFDFHVRTLPSDIRGGSVRFAISDAESALNDLMKASRECPLDINWSPALIYRQGLPVLSVDGASFADNDFYGWVRDSTKATPVDSTVRPLSYVQLQSMLDNPARWAQRSMWRSAFFDEWNENAAAALVDAILAAPSLLAQIFIERVSTSGHVTRPSLFPLGWAKFDILVTSTWRSWENDEENRLWVQQTFAAATDAIISKKSADAVTYVNYADRGEPTTPATTSEKLESVRSRIDPDHVFAR